MLSKKCRMCRLGIVGGRHHNGRWLSLGRKRVGMMGCII